MKPSPSLSLSTFLQTTTRPTTETLTLLQLSLFLPIELPPPPSPPRPPSKVFIIRLSRCGVMTILCDVLVGSKSCSSHHRRNRSRSPHHRLSQRFTMKRKE